MRTVVWLIAGVVLGIALATVSEPPVRVVRPPEPLRILQQSVSVQTPHVRTHAVLGYER